MLQAGLAARVHSSMVFPWEKRFLMRYWSYQELALTSPSSQKKYKFLHSFLIGNTWHHTGR